MSENVTNVSKIRLRKPERKEKIIDGLRRGLTINQIAKICNVTQRTICRDLKNWREKGDYDDWLQGQFLFLHDQEVQKEDHGNAYREITALWKDRMHLDKQKLEVSGQLQIVLKAWDLGNVDSKGNRINISTQQSSSA